MRHLLVIGVSLAAACGHPSDEAGAKQWSTPEPPALVDVPAGLSLSVTVNGVAKAPITAETLHGKRPDFTDPEHKAWRIPTLIPDAGAQGTIEAFDSCGVSVTFAHPMPDGFEPVLFLTRRGEIIVSAVNPAEPFPRFHGQGGRLKRPGDTSKPRLTYVARLEITAK